MKRHFWFSFVCVFSFLIIVAQVSAQDKITGPWLWMVAPCTAGQGGATATNLDQLDDASKGKVTEEDVAEDGAKKGDVVGDLEWVEGEISATGGNNIQDLINKNKGAWGGGWSKLAGDINDHSAYSLINIKTTKKQSGVTMRVGSDDSIKVWLNGEVVHVNPVNRGASDYQDQFNIDLVSGDNILLVKVSERGGGWSMFAGIDANFDTNTKFDIYSVEPGGKLATTWSRLKADR